VIPSSVGLSASEPRYWEPDAAIRDWLCAQIPSGARVLEIGPGDRPLPRADIYVDFAEIKSGDRGRFVQCDAARELLPFADKEFDFVYCRHLLEDTWNPFAICAEMSRVAKSGYIETPSPLAELCRGVDDTKLPYRGYHHHRWIVWDNRGQLTFVTKYPVVEYLGCDDAVLAGNLRLGPRYWNTYHLWNDRIDVRHLQGPLDFDIPREYPRLLGEAVSESIKSSDQFMARILAQQAA
jgi:hypothetical protein